MLFGSKRYLVAGLGNPGDKYKNTRHNVGFMAIDALCQKLNINDFKLKCRALITEGRIDDKRIIFAKPQTFMNLSGESIYKIMSYYKIPKENFIVIYDDVALPVGKIRIRDKGSDGGHNGVYDIIKNLNSEDFARIRIGVNKKPTPDYNLADWVLGEIPKSDLKLISERFDDLDEIISLIFDNKLSMAQSKFN